MVPDIFQRAQQWLKKLSGPAPEPEPDNSKYEVPEDQLKPCCNQSIVHIAFRGKSDDRLYLTKNRAWQETRFFDPVGMRVFCSVCRRRLV